MFRFSNIVRELTLNLAKVICILKHSVKLRRYLLCGCVTACHGMACLLYAVHSAQHTTQNRIVSNEVISPNFFNIPVNITLAMFSASSLMMVEDRNM